MANEIFNIEFCLFMITAIAVFMVTFAVMDARMDKRVSLFEVWANNVMGAAKRATAMHVETPAVIVSKDTLNAK